MSSRFSYSICERCWVTQNPTREPVRVVTDRALPREVCCSCLHPTWAGIFVLLHPDQPDLLSGPAYAKDSDDPADPAYPSTRRSS